MAAAHKTNCIPTRKPIKDWNAKTPAEQAAIDRMQAICKKNAALAENPNAVSAREAAIALRPSEEPKLSNPVEWQAPVRYGDGTGYCLSMCGGFSVAKVCVGGEFLYSAWNLRGDRECIGVKPSFEDAKALCK